MTHSSGATYILSQPRDTPLHSLSRRYIYIYIHTYIAHIMYMHILYMYIYYLQVSGNGISMMNLLWDRQTTRHSCRGRASISPRAQRWQLKPASPNSIIWPSEKTSLNFAYLLKRFYISTLIPKTEENFWAKSVQKHVCTLLFRTKSWEGALAQNNTHGHCLTILDPHPSMSLNWVIVNGLSQDKPERHILSSELWKGKKMRLSLSNI